MADPDERDALEVQVDHWRSYLQRRRAIRPVDVEELEDHLRDQVATLVDAGLATDEDFLVAVKRLGALDALSREFALEHSGRLWKQLVAAPDVSDESVGEARSEAIVVFLLAVVAALAVKVPELFGRAISGDDAGFYARNFSLFVFPLLTGYFAWKRRLSVVTCGWLVAMFAAAVVFANVFPFTPAGSTEMLTALHLPIALWLAVGIAYAGGRWMDGAGRMDFVRFSGELAIYYVLIALGGGVLTGFTIGMFESIGLEVEWLAEAWLLPCGALGAVMIGSWLVEAKQSVIENMAPVLTRLFTPLFAATLLVFFVTMAWTGRGIDIERNVLIAFDLLLVVVVGLLLYSVSARDPEAPPRCVRCAARGAGRQRPDRRRGGPGGNRCSDHGVRLHGQPDGRPGRERHSAREPGVVRMALHGVPAWPRLIRRSRGLANGLPSRIRRLGGNRRRHVPALVRLRLSAASPRRIPLSRKFARLMLGSTSSLNSSASLSKTSRSMSVACRWPPKSALPSRPRPSRPTTSSTPAIGPPCDVLSQMASTLPAPSVMAQRQRFWSFSSASLPGHSLSYGTSTSALSTVSSKACMSCPVGST